VNREEVQTLFITPIEELLNREPSGETVEQKSESLEAINTEILQAIENFDAFVLSNTPETIYTSRMLESMLEAWNASAASFRESFFQIIWENSVQWDLSWFSEHEKIAELMWAEWYEYWYNIVPLLAEFDELEFPSIENIDAWNLQAIWEEMAVAAEKIRNLDRQMTIIARDARELESEKTFWETRLDSAREYYESLMKNGDELTELGEALASNAWNLPEFEDLGMEHIRILRENNVNLARMFLVNGETWEAMESWILQEGNTYVINFSANEALQSQMDFAFINSSADVINVDGVELTLRRNSESPHWIWYYDQDGNRVPLLDGSQITVVALRDETNPHIWEAIDEEVSDRLNDFAERSTENRAFVEAVYRNPEQAFRWETLPWWITGAFLAILLNMFDGRNFVYNSETGLWEEKPEWSEEWSGSYLTNREVVDGYLGSMELGSLSAEFESSSQGPLAYNADDNGHGPSYGTYQMNSEVGVYRSFIQRHGIGEGREAWMAAVREHGVEEFQRMEHEHIQRMNYDQNLPDVPAWISSFGVETSASGTTLCSRTARRNLERLGLTNIHQWSSARASFEMYPSESIQAFPPANNTNATVADFYLDATSTNAQYGHRVAAFQRGWEWYVLDPYYSIPWYSNRTWPIRAEDYVNHMQNTLWRRMWWAAYFS